MQPLGWYLKRLCAMSVGEIAWRMRNTVRNLADYALLRLRQRPLPRTAVTGDASDGWTPSVRLSVLEVGRWLADWPQDRGAAGAGQLLAKADRIGRNQLSLFDLDACDLGDRISWNRDPKTGRLSPMRFAPWVDYRDVGVSGDCKFLWEMNRHHHLVVLARAYRATGEIRYAATVRSQIVDWLDQCPYGVGMNWRSPLELGVRLINWVWALDLAWEAGVFDGPFLERFIEAVYRHVWEIARKYSRGSSANNHLIGEAAGIFVASAYFHHLRRASQWRHESREILCREILDQTHPDGGTREQAFGYHLFALQFFTVAGILARAIGEDMPPDYWARLERMFGFLGALTEAGTALPMVGDCDEGYVLDIGGHRGDPRPWLAVGASLFGRPDLRDLAGAQEEALHWLPIHPVVVNPCGQMAARGSTLASRAFPATGYYLLQYGQRGSPDTVSVLFDCGDLGYRSIAAHAHADALAFCLRAYGADVLLDPGTYDYFTYPEWRRYFRSTRAHNTVVVDGQDQSTIAGPFMWSQKAEARCLRWEPTPTGGTVAGEHDGYGRLRDPVIHRRTLNLDGAQRKLAVRDDILARGEHEVEVFFHLAETCRVTGASENRFEIDVGPGPVTMRLDPRLAVRTLVGSEDPIGGWVSRGYHRKTPSTTIIGRLKTVGSVSLTHEIRIGDPRGA